MHLTNFSGDQNMHAVYMSLGNIRKETRNKVSHHAWVLLAKLPTPKFSSLNSQVFASEEEQEHMPGILKAKLYHVCMWKVLNRLRKHEVQNVMDPTRAHRCCMAWIADLEEQYLIAGLAKNACPPCKANFSTLGLDHVQQPQMGHKILETVKQLHRRYPTTDMWQFYGLAKDYDLLGIEEPCWKVSLLYLSSDLCQPAAWSAQNVHGSCA